MTICFSTLLLSSYHLCVKMCWVAQLCHMSDGPHVDKVCSQDSPWQLERNIMVREKEECDGQPEPSHPTLKNEEDLRKEKLVEKKDIHWEREIELPKTPKKMKK